jgi:hypothetical protein
MDAKSFLVSHGIPFQERDIRANPEYLRILTEVLDSRTIPTFVSGEKIIVGFDQAEYELLARRGDIKQNQDEIHERGKHL